MTAPESLALTLRAEAGGRPLRAIEALAALVVNRARLAMADAAGSQAPLPPAGDPVLAMCRRVAERAVAGALPDPTAGATHWHDADALPGWAVGRVPSAEIGGLVFYRIE